jgi:MYXO-CTERM domain-containing protein
VRDAVILVQRVASPILAFAALGAFAACAESSTPEVPPSGRAVSAILGGRPSGDDENAAVYIETTSLNDQGVPTTLRCSGRIIAPGLVVTARHCLLKRKTVDVRCNPDGSPRDIAEATDVRVEPPSAVTVSIGSDKSKLRAVAVKEIFTELEVSVCRSDIAFAALAEKGLDTRTPIRRSPPRVNETVSVTGWGFSSDDRSMLPTTRSTTERPITETGPGLIPADSFALGGGSVCLGDSGASALAGGVLVGVYSRIENPEQCSLELTRNIFVAVGAHLELATRAFAAIGEMPWFEGERPPWLAKAGAACTRGEECSSTICDMATSTCSAPCGDAGLACPPGKTCSAAQACVDPAPPPTPPASDDGGCAMSHAKAPPASALLIAAVVAVVLRRRRRSSY